MSEEKLSSAEVPQKLTEWLLEMGCPPEKVPPVEKISQMCRGQYYMVWRSLMEHVRPRKEIQEKRLQVFCDDVKNYQERSVFSERGNNKVVPKEILLWRQRKELKEKVADAETAVATGRQALQELMDKINRKVYLSSSTALKNFDNFTAAERTTSRQTLHNLQRRLALLNLVAEDWRTRKADLEETRTIAESLCNVERDTEEVKAKLDKCLSVLARPSSSAVASTSLLANPAANSTVVANNCSDVSDEEHIASLVRCGPSLWQELYERRAALANVLIAENTTQERNSKRNGVTPHLVLAHTKALQSSLALEALKQKTHISNTKKRLAAAATNLNLHGEACELLIVQCERACLEARVATLRELLADVTSRSGVFQAEGEGDGASRAGARRNIAAIDRAIESKMEELKRLVFSVSMTERKIKNVRECLLSVFDGFYKDVPNQDISNYRGIQLDLPQESVSSIRRFYEERRHRDASDTRTPRLVDELKFYLKEFNLENNRKVLLDSGEKIWIFETLSSSVSRLHTLVQSDECLPPIFNTAANVSYHLLKIMEEKHERDELEGVVKKLSSGKRSVKAIDTESNEKEIEQINDEIKKRLYDSLLSLQKTTKTLELGQENLKFWESNAMRKYISNKRCINGKKYKDYEQFYLENLFDVFS